MNMELTNVYKSMIQFATESCDFLKREFYGYCFFVLHDRDGEIVITPCETVGEKNYLLTGIHYPTGITSFGSIESIGVDVSEYPYEVNVMLGSIKYGAFINHGNSKSIKLTGIVR